jgi:hypothetical protein
MRAWDDAQPEFRKIDLKAMIEKSKPKNISEYIEAFPDNSQKRLREMLGSLREAAPNAEEAIKWGNPTRHSRLLWPGGRTACFSSPL